MDDKGVAMEISSSESISEEEEAQGGLTGVRWGLLGFAFHPAWMYLLFFSTGEVAGSLRASGRVYGDVYFSSVVALSLTMLAGLLFTRRFMCLSTRPALVVAAPVLASLGTLLYVANVASPHLWLVLGGGALTGIGSGLLAARWAALFGKYPADDLLANFALLLLAIVALCLSVTYLPREGQLALLICLPLLSGLCLARGEHRRRRDEGSGLGRFGIGAPKRTDGPMGFLLRLGVFVLAVALVGLTAALLGSFARSNGRFDYGGWFDLVATALVLIFVGVSLFVNRRTDFLPLFAVPVAALAVLLLPQMRISENLMADAFYPIGTTIFELLLLFASTLFARAHDASPAKCFMAARLSFALSDAGGTALGQAISSQADSFAIAHAASFALMVGAELLIAAMVAAALASRRKSPQTIGAPSAKPPRADDGVCGTNDTAEKSPLAAPTPHDAILTRCAALARQFGLTEREGDVLVLIAEGRSSARIQDDLSIAAGTVNYHTRNIYAKLGVHSRQEIIDMALGLADGENSGVDN